VSADRIDRYLRDHAEPRAKAAAATYRPVDSPPYDQCVVIPIYDEPATCLGQVCAALAHTRSLVIAVINVPEDAPTAARQRTLGLLQETALACPLPVLRVDCASEPLPTREGVGLARKIGTDLALLLWSKGLVRSPWFYQTDADARLPANYFHPVPVSSGAVVCAHRHHSNTPRLQQAVDLYDKHMAYYVAGLRAAGSAYAYHTLGSTLLIHAHTYAAVRGYPKRNAAEDFYLLNKAAKVHGVRTRTDVVITLEARLSARVPFGTGPALRPIVAALQTDPSAAFYLSYHPQSFTLLREALTLLDQYAATPTLAAPTHGSSTSSQQAWALLQHLRFERVRPNILSRYRETKQRRRALHEWFDAGKTLRFVHEARRYFPDQPLQTSLANMPSAITRHLTVPSVHTTDPTQ